MKYNTSQPKLIIPEYGRNIQKMVKLITEIKDRTKRNQQAKCIIEVMGNLNPQLRDIIDFHHKLWDQLFIMSDFKLDVDSPFDIPSKENYMEKPEKIKYSDNYIKFKHYGKIVPKLIERAIKTSDKKQKDELIFYIANHMKKCYLTWNKSSVDDEVIFKHLKILSNNELKLKEDTKLSSFNDLKIQKNHKKNNRLRNHHSKRK
jgi:hypothetical protein